VRWSAPETVAGFVQSPPNATLLTFAAAELARAGGGVLLDIGCGAGRNAVPLARQGWRVIGTDTSVPMLEAAGDRLRHEEPHLEVQLARAAMDALPVADAAADLVVAHGIWNLARGSEEFRRAVRDAARAARPGAGLFLFTFSRHTLPPSTTPVDGETFVFTQFAGEPQCFLTADEIVAELGLAGFEPDAAVPLRELNRPAGCLRTASGPVIYEGTFRRSSRPPQGS
jgi:SAM-dependent methyltransferase